MKIGFKQKDRQVEVVNLLQQLVDKISSPNSKEKRYSKCPSSLLPIVVTALNTGMRKGEILRLKRQDIDFKRGIIYVEHTKSGERREIPMNNLLTETLKDVIKSNKDNES